MGYYQEENETNAHYLGIQLNGGLSMYREDLLVPLGFRGPSLSLGAAYTYQDKQNLIQVHLEVGMGHLANRYSHAAWIMHPEFRTSWSKIIAKSHRWGRFGIGVCYQTQMNNLFFESWDDAHLYWLTSHNLGISAEWQNAISKNNGIIIRIESPVIAFVSRPQVYRYKKQEPLNQWTYHFTEPNRSLHIATWDAYRAIFLQILFFRKIRDALLSLGIEYHYAYYQKPKEIWGLNTSVVITYQWRIGS